MIRGHRLHVLVEAGLAPSVRWLEDQIRGRRIPARKIGRHWVMTDADAPDTTRRSNTRTGRPTLTS